MSALIQRGLPGQDVAVLLVAHDVNPILPYLDQVIYLAHGGAVIGAPAEVITAETLSHALRHTRSTCCATAPGGLVVVGQPDVARRPRHAPT